MLCTAASPRFAHARHRSRLDDAGNQPDDGEVSKHTPLASMATQYVWVLPYGFMSLWMASRIQAYWFMTPEAAALDFKTNMIPNGTCASLSLVAPSSIAALASDLCVFAPSGHLCCHVRALCNVFPASPAQALYRSYFPSDPSVYEGFKNEILTPALDASPASHLSTFD